MSHPAIVDPSNPQQMALFASACVLAKHLVYADGEAFFGGFSAQSTPVSVWQALQPGEKERWIRRAMDLLLANHAVQRPAVATGLGPTHGKIIGIIGPCESRSPDGDGTLRTTAGTGLTLGSSERDSASEQRREPSQLPEQSSREERSRAGSEPADSHHPEEHL
jgi:hypothetical protein